MDEVKVKEFSVTKQELGLNTIHDLLEYLTGYLSLTPEQQFRVTASVKRLIHSEKLTLLYRLRSYTFGSEQYPESAFDREFLKQIFDDKIETHKKWKQLPDEEVVTWSVGSHKYSQK